MSADLRLGDLVHVTADNCYLGLGLITAIEAHPAAYRVLTADGRSLFYFPFELAPVREGAV